ncbi:MAG: TetR/AcrR family transcriptional regulator [Bacteroidales bacterium]|nr:TetR/AcrR family transcriptional regulator [Bacteroidales bacterium]
MKKLKTDEAIQKVAAFLFKKFGFEKTSMEEIAREAHKSKRSVYNYFRNKEDLFSSLVSSEIEDMQKTLQTIIADDTQLMLPRLRQYLLQRVELIAAAENLRVAFRDKVFNDHSIRFHELNQTMTHFSQWEHGVFKQVWYAKPTQDTTETVEVQASAFADMLQVTLKGLTHTFFVEDKYLQYKTSYQMLIDLIINSVFFQFSGHSLPEFSGLTTSN